MDRTVLEKFETLVKAEKALEFSKVWERHTSGWKAVYTIQGLSKGTDFYPNLRFVFWLDADKKQITEDIVSYLHTQYCDYKSVPFTEDTLGQVYDDILATVKNERTNTELSKLITGGTDAFNDIIRKSGTQEFIQNLKWIPAKARPCPDTTFEFEFESNTVKKKFSMKCYREHWELSHDGKIEKIQMTDLPKTLISMMEITE